jgi:protein CpxP
MLCGATLVAAPAFAQQDAPPPPQQGDMQGPPHGGRGMMNPERRLAMMTHELNLTPEQQTAIKAVFAEEHAKMEAQRDQSQQMAPQDRRAAHEAEKAKIEAILTADQKTKYEAMEARMRERMEHHHDDNGGNPPPPPAQQ